MSLTKYICENCKKSFLREHYWEKDKTFCNHSCFLNYQSNNSKHILKNKEILRKILLTKYKNMCLNCHTNKKRIAIHHIDGSGDLANWEYSNNDLDNLIPLCFSCHAKLHNNLKRK